MSSFFSTGSLPKTILVTGGCGYLGSRLIRDLANDKQLGGVTIRILDNFQSGHQQALMGLPKEGRYQFIEGDILDPSIVRLALQGVDAVIHLAAIVRTPMSFDRPVWMEQVNRWGTIHLVDACLQAGVQRFIYASSAAVYGPGGPFSEVGPCHPLGPYAQSKQRAEVGVLKAAERGLMPTILRFGSIFGLAPVIRFDAVINHFVYLTGIGRPLTVYGDGQQIRPFIHVRDASEVICYCVDHPDFTINQIFNVISGNVSILELVEMVQSIRPDVCVRYTEQDVLTHVSFTVNNSTLFNLGWRPRFTIREGIAEFLEHFESLLPVDMHLLEVDE